MPQLTAISNNQDLAQRLHIPIGDVEELTTTWQGDTVQFIDALLDRCNHYDDVVIQQYADDDARREQAEDDGDYPF